MGCYLTHHLKHSRIALNTKELFNLMDPDDAVDVLRLMTYDDYSAGGMMSTEPIIMSAD
jgi:Mg/Co/Ni transporter MgtE